MQGLFTDTHDIRIMCISIDHVYTNIYNIDIQADVLERFHKS